MADLDKEINNSLQNPNNTDVSGYKKSYSFLDAVSKIQRYYIFERNSEKDFEGEFFTLSQIWEFLTIGFLTGFIESLTFIVLLPILQKIYPSFNEYFLRRDLDNLEYYFVNYSSYVIIVFITLWLCSLARYYEGTITKKAILSLVSGRAIAFILKGILIYYVFSWLYKVSYIDKESVYLAIDWIKFLIDFLPTDYTYTTDDLYIYYYRFVAPSLKSIAKEAIIAMSIMGTLPFMTILIKGYIRAYQKVKSKVEYENY